MADRGRSAADAEHHRRIPGEEVPEVGRYFFEHTPDRWWTGRGRLRGCGNGTEEEDRGQRECRDFQQYPDVSGSDGKALAASRDAGHIVTGTSGVSTEPLATIIARSMMLRSSRMFPGQE